jgi:hypothetical protein
LDGRQRHKDFTYPDTEWFYYLCAERFGWTPNEVDEQPARIIDWVIAISLTVKEMENDNQ